MSGVWVYVENRDGAISAISREVLGAGRIVADARVDELRAMRGEQSLEDIFLELTGGTDVDDMVKELEDVG